MKIFSSTTLGQKDAMNKEKSNKKIPRHFIYEGVQNQNVTTRKAKDLVKILNE